MLGSDKDPTWRDFPLALTDTRGARCYVTLFKAPFEASVLSDRENNALQTSSLRAMPPPPGMPSLARLTIVDLTGASLTQWASYIQDVASGMRMPLEVAVNCPQEDIVRVLNRLETLTHLKYCLLCFGIGNKCRCTKVSCQTPSQASALWTPLTMSYATMASPTMTTASAPVHGVPQPGYPPPRPPPGPPPGDPALMDTLLAPSTENLLATAGVGRGLRWPRTPTAPVQCQVQPSAIQQWMPPQEGTRWARRPLTGSRFIHLDTPLRHGRLPPRPSATPRTSQGHDETATGGEDARGRSSSRGPQGQDRRDRSSTRGSRKHC